jgi:hypothetical protein
LGDEHPVTELLHTEARHFVAGCYLCPQTRQEIPLESSVPRPWVYWPVQVHCVACGQDHLIEYDDVIHVNPAFGHE